MEILVSLISVYMVVIACLITIHAEHKDHNLFTEKQIFWKNPDPTTLNIPVSRRAILHHTQCIGNIIYTDFTLCI